MFELFIGFPASFGNIKSSSEKGHANFHFLSAVIMIGPKSILRFDVLVLTLYHAPLLKVRWIWIWLFSQSMSGHLRPKSSLCLAPLKIASINKVWYFWFVTASRGLFISSGLRTLIVDFLSLPWVLGLSISLTGLY